MIELSDRVSTELKGEMSDVRGEMAKLRADMVAGFANAKIETQRLIGAGMAANAIAVIAAIVS